MSNVQATSGGAHGALLALLVHGIDCCGGPRPVPAGDMYCSLKVTVDSVEAARDGNCPKRYSMGYLQRVSNADSRVWLAADDATR